MKKKKKRNKVTLTLGPVASYLHDLTNLSPCHVGICLFSMMLLSYPRGKLFQGSCLDSLDIATL